MRWLHERLMVRPLRSFMGPDYAGAGGAKTRSAPGQTLVVIGRAPRRSPLPYATMPGDEIVASRAK